VEVKDRILVEAGLLFGKYGIKSMTMDALAEELGISKRTIYERFKDKDTLLKEVILYYKEQTKKQANELIDQSDNAIEAIFRIIRMTIDQMTRMSPAFLHDIKKYHPRVFMELAEPGEFRDLSVTRRLLETGMEQRVFRNDFNIEIVNRTLHVLFDLFGHDSLMVEAGFDRRDMLENVLVPYFRGISTEKGQKFLIECKPIIESKHTGI
jgi:AcrR family transcriptional regulator